MKQKRTFIAVLAIIAVLALGVAYALEVVPFTIQGTAAATASSANFKVGVTAFEQTAVNNVATDDSLAPAVVLGEGVSLSGTGLQTVNFVATGFSTAEDSVTATVTVKNSSDTLKAKLSGLTPVNSTNFTITNTNFVVDSAAAAAEVTLNPSQTATFTVTIKLNGTPLSDISAETLKVTFNAEAVAM